MTDFRPGRRTKAAALLLATLLGAAPAAAGGAAPARTLTDAPARTLTGAAAFGDWTTDAPGTRRRIAPADLPPPGATPSASNSPRLVPRPADAWPKVPPGFAVDVFAEHLEGPREMRVAPNGDIFVAEGQAGRISVLRAGSGTGPASATVFAKGLNLPFGMAFYPPGPDPRYVYVANTDSVVRFPYRTGDREARGKPETVIPRLPEGGHWTRNIVFSPDGSRLFIAVGSESNVQEHGADETNRADILVSRPDGSGLRVFAAGIRNPVGLAVNPETGELWCATNERDGLGDDLVPDYVTRVAENGFYGWPWFYIGGNRDPRHPRGHEALRGKVIVPDVLLQSHSAPLGLTFYTGNSFPAAWRGDGFATAHGSWNRARRTGYKVVRVPLDHGKPTGVYEDFMTGFVTPDGQVWGRPVGVAVTADGALLVSDDAGGRIWRVRWRQP